MTAVACTLNLTLMGESLMDKTLLAETDTRPVYKPLPDITVVKVGGQSIIDRGRKALLPILDELVAARKTHPLIIATGGGTRARHAYAIATDLGMPTGVLAHLGASISEQNALMLSILLLQHGGVLIDHSDIPRLAHLYCAGQPAHCPRQCRPTACSSAHPIWAAFRRHRTDAGTFLLAEVLGARRCILIKDEQGLYTADPKKDPAAKFIPEIELTALLNQDLADLAVERSIAGYSATRSQFERGLYCEWGWNRAMLRVLWGVNTWAHAFLWRTTIDGDNTVYWPG